MSDSFTNNLFIIVAPSGAGKSTLVNALIEQDKDIKLSVSCTTRPMRPGDKNGREFHFITPEEFQEKRAAGDFLESAEVHGNYYGTSEAKVMEFMKAGNDVLLVMDWQGAQQVRKLIRSAIGIFILPPSIEELEKRLVGRGTDEPNVITRRLLAAGGEIAHACEFDYVIVNDKFEDALAELKSIVTAARCKFRQQTIRNAQLFAMLGIHG